MKDWIYPDKMLCPRCRGAVKYYQRVEEAVCWKCWDTIGRIVKGKNL